MSVGSAGPPVLLTAEANWRELAGLTLFSRGGTDVDAPLDVARYEDIMEALCSYTSQAGASLQEDAQASWDAGTAPVSVVTFGIDRDNLVYAHSSTTAFTLTATGSAWGFAAGAIASTPTGGLAPYGAGHIVKASTPWTPGKFVFGAAGNYLTIDPSGAAVAFDTPNYVGAVSALPVLLRHSGIGDADAVRVLNCLEYWDNEATDTALRRIRWGIDDTGRIFTTRPNGVSARVSWVNTSLMQRFGFTGDEIEVASGSLRTLTATNEPWYAVLPLGLRRCDPWREEDCDVLELRNGDAAVQELAVRSGWEVEVYLAGPAMRESNLTRHWQDRFLSLARVNRGVTVFRHWGDTRRALPRRDITSTQLAYDLLYTSAEDGERGRLRCVRDPSDSRRRTPVYLGQPAVLNQQLLILRNRND